MHDTTFLYYKYLVKKYCDLLTIKLDLLSLDIHVYCVTFVTIDYEM